MVLPGGRKRRRPGTTNPIIVSSDDDNDDGCDDDDFEQPLTHPSRPKRLVQSTLPTFGIPSITHRRKRVNGGDHIDVDAADIDDIEHVSDGSDDDMTPRKLRKRSNEAPNTKSKSPWAAEFAALHKQNGTTLLSSRKAGEIRNFLTSASVSGNQQRLLLLSGPPGCGKTSAIRLLSSRLALDVRLWDVPAIHDTSCSSLTAQLLDSLRTFLLDCKYASKSIALIDDLPVTLASASSGMGMVGLEKGLADTLLSAAQFSPLPVVVVLSDGARPVALAMRALLTAQPALAGYIAHVAVPAVTDAAMKRRLVAVTAAKQVCVPKDILCDLVVSSGGDFRSALNSLEFCCRIHTHPNTTTHDARGRASRKKARNQFPSSVTSTLVSVGTDSRLALYHCVSKILNNKRTTDGHSIYDVDTLLTDAACDDAILVQFLHENYAPFFGDLIGTVSALHTLSYADTFLAWASSHDDLSRSMLRTCAATVTARAFLAFNKVPVRSGWRPIRGPVRTSANATESIALTRRTLTQTRALGDVYAVVPTQAVHDVVTFLRITGQMQGSTTNTNDEHLYINGAKVADVADLVLSNGTQEDTQQQQSQQQQQQHEVDDVSLGAAASPEVDSMAMRDAAQALLEDDIEDWDDD